MADDARNENVAHNVAPPFTSDANGDAAILLVESLIHGLISKSVISVAEAVEIVEIAADVTTAIAAEADGPHAQAKSSSTVLGEIVKSLKHDMR